jgi:hypothetical protein
MAVYTHTITASEYSLKYKPSSSWTNYTKLYDGNVGTYPSNQSGSIGLLIDMSWLPNGMRLCGIQGRVGAKRTGSSNISMWLRSTDSTGEPGSGHYYALADMTYDKGEFNTWSWHELIGDGEVVGGTIEISKQQSDDFMAKAYQYITLNANVQKSEIELTFLYTEAEDTMKLYIGANQASAVFIGTTKASAVYVGTTKVL